MIISQGKIEVGPGSSNTALGLGSEGYEKLLILWMRWNSTEKGQQHKHLLALKTKFMHLIDTKAYDLNTCCKIYALVIS